MWVLHSNTSRCYLAIKLVAWCILHRLPTQLCHLGVIFPASEQFQVVQPEVTLAAVLLQGPRQHVEGMFQVSFWVPGISMYVFNMNHQMYCES